jgi:hypothetical protein
MGLSLEELLEVAEVIGNKMDKQARQIDGYPRS